MSAGSLSSAPSESVPDPLQLEPLAQRAECQKPDLISSGETRKPGKVRTSPMRPEPPPPSQCFCPCFPAFKWTVALTSAFLLVAWGALAAVCVCVCVWFVRMSECDPPGGRGAGARSPSPAEPQGPPPLATSGAQLQPSNSALPVSLLPLQLPVPPPPTRHPRIKIIWPKGAGGGSRRSRGE